MERVDDDFAGEDRGFGGDRQAVHHGGGLGEALDFDVRVVVFGDGWGGGVG